MSAPHQHHDRSPRPALHRSGLAGLRPRRGWELHPGVRSGDRLSRGERVADLARDRLGSWPVALTGVTVLGAGIVLDVRRGRAGPGVVLGLMLCGLVILDLSLVLMAARRADRTASELASYQLASDRRSAATVADLRDEVDRLRTDVARLSARLQTSRQVDQAGGEP